MNERSAGPRNASLPDEEARTAIATELETNLMVRAGAGTGKTHALVGRVVATVAAGYAPVDAIAAITFTRKAAGELRTRLAAELRAAAAVATGDAAPRLAAAVEDVDQCFVGTIHAFCGRLLRERPVEAGLPPDFVEVDDREEADLRESAWSAFLNDAFLNDSDHLVQLERVGIVPPDLKPFFDVRAQFSDLPLKGTPFDTVTAQQPPLDDAAKKVITFVHEASEQIPKSLPKGPDESIRALRWAANFIQKNGVKTAPDQVRLLREIHRVARRPDVKVGHWGLNRTYAAELKSSVLPHLEKHVIEPALRSWKTYAYAIVAAFIDDALASWLTRIRRSGTVTFQDMLLLASRMLREHPEVRRQFQSRYRVLFVDEYQDTDPIQTEVVLFLTGSDAEERNWRKLLPRPGSLFVVGDEKQSIYRFRRADIDTFRLMQQRIEESGGRTVELGVSFRSLDGICDWINTAFHPLFYVQARKYQAGYDPLKSVRPSTDAALCVRKLTIDKKKQNDRALIVDEESDRVATFIKAATQGKTVFNQGADEGHVLADTARPGDFMILTRTRKMLYEFAAALERYEIPYDITGGQPLNRSKELKSLLTLFRCVHRPDNPVAMFAFLRGTFVGLGDDELYAFRRAGGRFDYRYPLPASLAADLFQASLYEKLNAAWDLLKYAERVLLTKTVAVAFELILERTGLLPFSASLKTGSSRAGNLLRVLALVRKWQDGGMHWGEAFALLDELHDDAMFRPEEMTLESGAEDVVRVMNVHQAKGLEARVVFLVDPYDRWSSDRQPEYHVSRTGDRPFLSLPVTSGRRAQSSDYLAEPVDWETDAAEESHYLKAEEVRLTYVAATRARNLLVVSHYPGNTQKGPWTALDAALENVAELERAEPDHSARVSIPLVDTSTLAADRQETMSILAKPSFSVVSVTEEGDLEPVTGVKPGYGREVGTLVHQILEDAVSGRLPANERAYIGALVKAAKRDEALVDQIVGWLGAFRSSEIWQEINGSTAVYVEVPVGQSQRDDGVRLLRGSIDVIYLVEGGWKIVDYKTDAHAEPEELADKYGAQVRAYARMWPAVTGEPVVAAGLWSVPRANYIPVL